MFFWLTRNLGAPTFSRMMTLLAPVFCHLPLSLDHCCPLSDRAHSFGTFDQREDALAVRGNRSAHGYDTLANLQSDSVNLVVAEVALQLHA